MTREELKELNALAGKVAKLYLTIDELEGLQHSAEFTISGYHEGAIRTWRVTADTHHGRVIKVILQMRKQELFGEIDELSPARQPIDVDEIDEKDPPY